MLWFDVDDAEMSRMANALGATTREIELARSRALRRTASNLRRLSSTGLKSELGLRNVTALRRRIKQTTLRRGRSAIRLWYGANDLPISAFKGRARKVAGGIRFGDTMIHGAFFARLDGRRGIYSRIGRERWQIEEATLPVADRMMIFLEDEVFVDLPSIFFRNFEHEIRAATVLGIGEGRRR